MRRMLWYLLLLFLCPTILPFAAPEIAADDLSGRIAHLQRSLAIVERDRALAEQSGDAQAMAVLDEVHRNIAFTVADIQDDAQPAGNPPRAVVRGPGIVDRAAVQSGRAAPKDSDRRETEPQRVRPGDEGRATDADRPRRGSRSRSEALPPPGDQPRSRAMHLNSAARHLEVAGYESWAAKVREELQKHERRDRATRRPGGPASPSPAERRIGRVVDELSSEVGRLQRDVDALKRQMQKKDADRRRRDAAEKRRELERKRRKAQQERAQPVEKKRRGQRQREPAIASIRLESQLMLELRRSIQELERQILADRAKWGSDHPKVRLLRESLARLEERLAEREKKIADRELAAAEAFVDFVRQEYELHEQKRNELQKAYDDQFEQATNVSAKALKLAELEEALERAERTFDLLNDRIQEVDLTQDVGADGEKRKTDMVIVLEILRKEKRDRDAELEERRQAVADFRAENPELAVRLDNQEVVSQRFSALAQELSRNEIDILEAKARFQRVQKMFNTPSQRPFLIELALSEQRSADEVRLESQMLLELQRNIQQLERRLVMVAQIEEKLAERDKKIAEKRKRQAEEKKPGEPAVDKTPRN